MNTEQRSRDLGDIVQSAPNKTVSDIHHSDCIDCRTVQKLLADTGIGDLDLGPEFLSDLTRRSHSPNIMKIDEKESGCPGSSDADVGRVPDELLGACAADNSTGSESLNLMTIIDFDGASGNSSTPGGVFGIIKDISVSNIDFGENDKLSEKPKIIDSVTDYHDNLSIKTPNVCWSSDKKRPISEITHDESDSLKLLDQAIGGQEETSVENKWTPPPEIEEEEDEGLSLTKYINELSFKGCETDGNISNEDKLFVKKVPDRHPLDFPPPLPPNVDSDQNIDLDMSVKSGYNSAAKPLVETDETKPPFNQDLSMEDFDEEMHEAEAVVNNFLNAQLLKNFPLESQFDNLFDSVSASELQDVHETDLTNDVTRQSGEEISSVGQELSPPNSDNVNEDSNSTFV